MAEPVEEMDSLVHVSPSEAFPKRPLHMDNPALETPYPELCGESIEFIGEASNGAVITLSNYRLLICYAKSFVNVPIGLIDTAECKDQDCLVISCKDGKSIRCQFDTSDYCQEWHSRVMGAIEAPSKIEDIFAFSFHAWCFDHIHREPNVFSPGVCFLEGTGKVVHCKFQDEVSRLGYDLTKAWRVFDNSEFKYCPTYPLQHVIPGEIDDEMMKKSANFRTSKRFPSVVWRHKGNGAVIARCSQPGVGWLGWRSEEDEKIIAAILRACSLDDPRRKQHSCNSNGHVRSEQNGITRADSQEELRRSEHECASQYKNILIVDARSYAAAFANRAKGGGCEYTEYYTCCVVEFMGLANIHTIRKSFNTVHALCSNTSLDQTTWLSSLEATKWLQNLSMLLKSAVKVVNAVDQEARPVIVHCSDGWDRTPQIVALSEIMLDPYYRTVQGFQAVVEREWLDFGHKFADRCGHRPGPEDVNERCPVFLQWLDCIHQLLRQYPTSFEFNETFLVKLVQHTYSCLFGTFLCNTLKARLKYSVKERTCSVWSLLAVEGSRYKNFLYDSKTQKVLYPSCDIRELHLWTAVYLSETCHSICEDSGPSPLNQAAQSGTSPADSPKLSRTRSFDNIHATASEEEPHTAGDTPALTRTSSDPNLSDLKLESTLGTSPKNRMIPPLPLEKGCESQEQIGVCDMPSVEKSKSQEKVVCGDGTGEEGMPLTNGHSVQDSFPTKNCQNGDLINGDVELASREVLTNGDVVLSNGHTDLDTDDGSSELTNGCSETQFTNGVEENLEGTDHEEPLTNGEDVVLSQSPDVALKNGLTNGHIEDSEISELDSNEPSSPACSTPRKSERTRGIINGHMESSTETVTEDSLRYDGPQPLVASGDCSGFDHSPLDSAGSSTPNGELLNGHTDVLNLLQQSCTISTSTSDISNSHVDYPIVKSPSLPIPLPANHIPSLPAEDIAKNFRRVSQGCVSNGPSRQLSQVALASEPSFSTCLSRTSSCGIGNGVDAAAAGDVFVDSGNMPLRLGRHLDLDGLTCLPDHAQRRMLGLMREHREKEEMYRQRERILLAIVERLRQEVASANRSPSLDFDLEELDIQKCNLLNPECDEQRPNSRCSSFRSDVSWEQVEEGDTRCTLWIPDHAVSHCSQCNSRFNLVNRKHHCRNCGQIFCSSCSNYFIPIPREQLYQPQRVCQPCHQQLDEEARRRHEQTLEGSRQMGTVRDG